MKLKLQMSRSRVNAMRWLLLSLLVCFSSACQSAPDSLLATLRNRARHAPVVVAHRGASGEYPENTIPAFVAALEQGSTFVELDFYESSDGVLFCLHDKTLDRTTDADEKLGKKKIAATLFTMAELQDFDAGAWKNKRFAGTQIPTLAAALDCIQAGAWTMIERKGGSAKALVDLLRKKKLVDKVLVQAFDWKWLAEVHRLEPGLLLAALGSGELDQKALAGIVMTGACMVHWKLEDLRVESVLELHELGYLTCAYTVNDDAGLLGGARLGLHAITTNYPARLRELLRSGRARR